MCLFCPLHLYRNDRTYRNGLDPTRGFIAQFVEHHAPVSRRSGAESCGSPEYFCSLFFPSFLNWWAYDEHRVNSHLNIFIFLHETLLNGKYPIVILLLFEQAEKGAID